MVLKLEELNKRRFFGWEDFLKNYKSIDFKRDEIEYFKEQIEKGNKCQEVLNKSFEDFTSYKSYVKAILLYLSIQDDVIKDIKEYQEQIIKCRKGSSCLNKSLHWNEI